MILIKSYKMIYDFLIIRTGPAEVTLSWKFPNQDFNVTLMDRIFSYIAFIKQITFNYVRFLIIILNK